MVVLSRIRLALLSLAVLSWSATGGSAQTISREEARRRVEEVERYHRAALAKFPAFAELDQVIRDDCALKVSGHTNSDKFCECVSALTMQLWLTGADPNLFKLLEGYLNGTGSLKPGDFVRYEGPELYKPLCEHAP